MDAAAARGVDQRPQGRGARRRAGAPALTRWRVRERFSGAALLEVELETGRQHQIRVHLAHVRPAGRSATRSTARLRRSRTGRMLHALRLAFAHPITGERVAAESPLPEDMRRVLASLQRTGVASVPSAAGTSPPAGRQRGAAGRSQREGGRGHGRDAAVSSGRRGSRAGPAAGRRSAGPPGRRAPRGGPTSPGRAPRRS